MNRKLIIFDFDGTLADTLPVFLRLFDEAADKYGFKRLDRDRQQALRALDARQMMAIHEVPLWKVPAIATFMRSGMARSVTDIRLFGGIEDVLRELKARGVELTIVSSNSRSNVVKTLGPDIASLFSQCECGAALFGKLPKIRKVLAASGVAPEHAMLIGDEIRDAKVAAEAGVDFGAVAWGYNHVDALIAEQPARVFRQVDELLSGIAPFRPE
ncbi:HAD hydrolase-like protein [Duganella aceris]|uniref:HAD hydrolase-like protein n=1 Tax=Duganella aceris TaxID=2703883 RepID=A0ABX0FF32_9BURK|nr:HAD hydrolase-like protein [Duganella aceris]NGZ83152.1 HAD hydrolase-like protein [Duganella aceris]